MKYSKLVRDKIPEIIKEKGEVLVTHIASDAEYEQKLKEKLQEEVAEFLEAENQEEMADVLEVIDAICNYRKWVSQAIAKIKDHKANERGKFEKRIITELEVTTLPANHPYTRPRVGIGVMIWKDGKVLLGKRKSSHGDGEYAWPGGHLDYMESFADCAKREVKEETGIAIKNIRFLRLLNMKAYAPKHYVHVSLSVDWESGNPQVLEPDKCVGWDWYDLNNLPTPLFATVADDMEAYRTGQIYWDS